MCPAGLSALALAVPRKGDRQKVGLRFTIWRWLGQASEVVCSDREIKGFTVYIGRVDVERHPALVVHMSTNAVVDHVSVKILFEVLSECFHRFVFVG